MFTHSHSHQPSAIRQTRTSCDRQTTIDRTRTPHFVYLIMIITKYVPPGRFLPQWGSERASARFNPSGGLPLSSKFFIISQRDSRQSISAWGKEESGGGVMETIQLNREMKSLQFSHQFIKMNFPYFPYSLYFRKFEFSFSRAAHNREIIFTGTWPKLCI